MKHKRIRKTKDFYPNKREWWKRNMNQLRKYDRAIDVARDIGAERIKLNKAFLLKLKSKPRLHETIRDAIFFETEIRSGQESF